MSVQDQNATPVSGQQSENFFLKQLKTTSYESYHP